ncbi:NIMA interactive [Cordyceps militaris]|uniref:NIMA interactive n=1 Tax=Cordyceps militaris TaxID=73501 RepID=A0A2H4SNZ2_CORMI|nr:NIMA interactive [Cordyceps militaris]
MAETENLRTASAYINNQLLSRGLLRDGQTIDFAGHGKREDASVTAGRIISVVNDLILRRDRDADHRESLSTTMRSLRAENTKHVNDIAKLEEKNAEAQRKLEIATAAENAAKTQLKSAESTMRGLREQLSRTKGLVAQTRTSCATEVRRRDRQIDTLKKQLGEAGRARGARANPAITTITIAGNFDEEPPSPTKTGGIMNDEYSLRGESTVSLAKLSQSLSEENEAVLALMSQAMDELREMSGLEQGRTENTQNNRQKSLEDMSTELEDVMEHMRHILNNPSFVPIEEVVIREEEINRLKDGWVKMETRWKDAMLLIDGWHRRMAAGGSPIREDELKLGFRLGSVRLTGTRSLVGDSTLAPLPEESYDEEEQAQHADEDIYDRSDVESEGYNEEEAAVYDHEEVALDRETEEAPTEAPIEEIQQNVAQQESEVPRDAHETREPQVEAEDAAVEDVSRESTPLPEQPQLSPLRNSSSAGNRGSQQAQPTVTVRRKQPETTSSSSLPAPAQRPRPASGALYVQKRGLEQPGRRPTRIATRAPEANLNTRPATRVTSLEEALLSKPAQALEWRIKESTEKQPATTTETTTQPTQEPTQESTEDALPETRLRKTTTSTNRRTVNQSTPYKRFPQPAEPVPQQSPLTMSNIAAKLAASEASADRVRAKVLAARSRSTTLKLSNSLQDLNGVAHEECLGAAGAESQTREQADDLENVDPAKTDPERPVPEQDNGHLKVQKRKRDIRISSKRTSRRRSTLSPMELETLIAGNGQ